MNMKCLVATGIAAFAIVGLLVWSQIVYEYTILILIMVVLLGLLVAAIWDGLYSFCSRRIDSRNAISTPPFPKVKKKWTA